MLSKCVALFLVAAVLLFPAGARAQTSPQETIRALYEQAVDAFNKQQFDRSIELYKDIIKLVPQFAPAYIGIGLALKSNGAELDEVLHYYKTGTEMDPTNAQAFEQLGRLYYSVNKFTLAEKAFLKVLSIDPSSMSAKLSIAWVYLLGKSKPKLALKYFKDVNAKVPSANTTYGLGMAYFASNDRISALEVITQLRKMKEDEYADRLEAMVRENRKVVLQEASDEPQDPKKANIQSSTTPADPATVSKNTGNPDQGVKVRLRGKLADLDQNPIRQ